jgi:hypothetical protein
MKEYSNQWRIFCEGIVDFKHLLYPFCFWKHSMKNMIVFVREKFQNTSAQQQYREKWHH